MKLIAISLLGILLTTWVSAGTDLKECFDLNAQSASAPDKVCFFSIQDKSISTQYAEVYTEDNYLLEQIGLTSKSTLMNLGHGVVWNLVVSIGEGKVYSVKATRNSGAGIDLNYLKNRQTNQTYRAYVYKPYTGGSRTCNGRGRCI